MTTEFERTPYKSAREHILKYFRGQVKREKERLGTLPAEQREVVYLRRDYVGPERRQTHTKTYSVYKGSRVQTLDYKAYSEVLDSDLRAFEVLIFSIENEVKAYIRAGAEEVMDSPYRFLRGLDLRLNVFRVLAAYMTIPLDMLMRSYTKSESTPILDFNALESSRKTTDRVRTGLEDEGTSEWIAACKLRTKYKMTYSVDPYNCSEMTLLNGVFYRLLGGSGTFEYYENRVASAYNDLRYGKVASAAFMSIYSLHQARRAHKSNNVDMLLDMAPKYKDIVSTITDPQLGNYRIVVHKASDVASARQQQTLRTDAIVLYKAVYQVRGGKNTKNVVWKYLGVPSYMSRQVTSSTTLYCPYDVEELGYWCSKTAENMPINNIYSGQEHVDKLQKGVPPVENIFVSYRGWWSKLAALQVKYEAGITIWSTESWDGKLVSDFKHTIEAVNFRPLDNFEFPYIALVDWAGVFANYVMTTARDKRGDLKSDTISSLELWTKSKPLADRQDAERMRQLHTTAGTDPYYSVRCVPDHYGPHGLLGDKVPRYRYHTGLGYYGDTTSKSPCTELEFYAKITKALKKLREIDANINRNSKAIKLDGLLGEPVQDPTSAFASAHTYGIVDLGLRTIAKTLRIDYTRVVKGSTL